jgi:nitrite reductase/ring-hydroxylating ferredoxin subunit
MDYNPASIKPPLARLSLSDVPDGGAIRVDVAFKSGQKSVVVTRQGDVLAAFLNTCPHARWPLDTFDGRFLFTQDGALICAAHSAVFHPLSGACLGGPSIGTGLTPVPLRQNGEDWIIHDL